MSSENLNNLLFDDSDSTVIVPHGPVLVKKEKQESDVAIVAPVPVKPAGKPVPKVVTPDWKVVAEYRAKDIQKLRKQIDEQSTRIREYIAESEQHERDYKAQAEELSSALDENALLQQKLEQREAQIRYWRAIYREFVLRKGTSSDKRGILDNDPFDVDLN